MSEFFDPNQCYDNSVSHPKSSDSTLQNKLTELHNLWDEFLQVIGDENTNPEENEANGDTLQSIYDDVFN